MKKELNTLVMPGSFLLAVYLMFSVSTNIGLLLLVILLLFVITIYIIRKFYKLIKKDLERGKLFLEFIKDILKFSTRIILTFCFIYYLKINPDEGSFFIELVKELFNGLF